MIHCWRWVQSAAVIVVAAAVPVSAQTAKTFPDVPREHWAADAVGELARLEILRGDEHGSFAGRRAVTRYEAAQGLQRFERSVPVLISHFLTKPPSPGPQGNPGLPGPRGERGPTGPVGPTGAPPPAVEELQRELPVLQQDTARLRSLFGDFRVELDRLRGEIEGIKLHLGEETERTERLRRDIRRGPFR